MVRKKEIDTENEKSRIGNGERYGRGTGQIYINIISTFTESRYKEKVNMIKRVENDKGKQRRVHAARVHHGLTNYIETKAKCRHQKNLPLKGLCGRCLSV
jgi:hypothetical protein